jgi:CelD/BcsL family acetyltransferase involved in cellulose biosynthesis
MSVKESSVVLSEGAVNVQSLAQLIGADGWMLQEARSIEEFQQIRGEWLLLRHRTGIRTPNADPDRFIATLAALGESAEPYVVLAFSEGVPRAGIMGRLTSRISEFRMGYVRVRGPTLRFLDIVYGGLLADNEPESQCRIVDHLMAALRNNIDAVSINHLPTEGELFARITDRGAIASGSELHWRYRLVPHDYEATVSHLSGRHRSDLRREDRRLCQHFNNEVNLRVFTQVEDLEACVRAAASVAQRTYQAGLGVAFSDSALWRGILLCEARQGRMRCYVLECQGQPIAFQIGAAYGSIYCPDTIGYLAEFQHLSPGRVLHLRVIQDLCAAGFEEYDHGFGDAAYKRIFGTCSWEEASLDLWGRGRAAWTARVLQGVTDLMASIGKGVLKRAGGIDRVKRAWRKWLRPTP